MNNKGMKFLAVLAVLAMAFAVFAVVSDLESSDADPVVVDGTDFFEPSEADPATEVKLGSTVTVKLLKDISLSETVTFPATIPAENGTVYDKFVINMNGHSITSDGQRAFWVKSGTVTITGEGTIKSTGDSLTNNSSVIRVGDSATDATAAAKLTIDSKVKITTDRCYAVSVFGYNTSGIELVVKGTLETTGEAPAIGTNGRSDLAATTISIESNAKVTSEQDYAIYHPGAGTITIKGEVTGKGGIEMKSGTLYVKSGATITSTATEVSHVVNTNGTSTFGYAIAGVMNSAYKAGVQMNLQGGEVNGILAIIEDDPAPAGVEAPKFKITGGVYSDYSVLKYTDASSAGASVAAGGITISGSQAVTIDESFVTAGTLTIPGTSKATVFIIDDSTPEFTKLVVNAGDKKIVVIDDKSTTVETAELRYNNGAIALYGFEKITAGSITLGTAAKASAALTGLVGTFTFYQGSIAAAVDNASGYIDLADGQELKLSGTVSTLNIRLMAGATSAKVIVEAGNEVDVATSLTITPGITMDVYGTVTGAGEVSVDTIEVFDGAVIEGVLVKDVIFGTAWSGSDINFAILEDFSYWTGKDANGGTWTVNDRGQLTINNYNGTYNFNQFFNSSVVAYGGSSTIISGDVTVTYAPEKPIIAYFAGSIATVQGAGTLTLNIDVSNQLYPAPIIGIISKDIDTVGINVNISGSPVFDYGSFDASTISGSESPVLNYLPFEVADVPIDIPLVAVGLFVNEGEIFSSPLNIDVLTGDDKGIGVGAVIIGDITSSGNATINGSVAGAVIIGGVRETQISAEGRLIGAAFFGALASNSSLSAGTIYVAGANVSQGSSIVCENFIFGVPDGETPGNASGPVLNKITNDGTIRASGKSVILPGARLTNCALFENSGGMGVFGYFENVAGVIDGTAGIVNNTGSIRFYPYMPDYLITGFESVTVDDVPATVGTSGDVDKNKARIAKIDYQVADIVKLITGLDIDTSDIASTFEGFNADTFSFDMNGLQALIDGEIPVKAKISQLYTHNDYATFGCNTEFEGTIKVGSEGYILRVTNGSTSITVTHSYTDDVPAEHVYSIEASGTVTLTGTDSDDKPVTKALTLVNNSAGAPVDGSGIYDEFIPTYDIFYVGAGTVNNTGTFIVDCPHAETVIDTNATFNGDITVKGSSLKIRGTFNGNIVAPKVYVEGSTDTGATVTGDITSDFVLVNMYGTLDGSIIAGKGGVDLSGTVTGSVTMTEANSKFVARGNVNVSVTYTGEYKATYGESVEPSAFEVAFNVLTELEGGSLTLVMMPAADATSSAAGVPGYIAYDDMPTVIDGKATVTLTAGALKADGEEFPIGYVLVIESGATFEVAKYSYIDVRTAALKVSLDAVRNYGNDDFGEIRYIMSFDITGYTIYSNIAYALENCEPNTTITLGDDGVIDADVDVKTGVNFVIGDGLELTINDVNVTMQDGARFTIEGNGMISFVAPDLDDNKDKSISGVFAYDGNTIRMDGVHFWAAASIEGRPATEDSPSMLDIDVNYYGTISATAGNVTGDITVKPRHIEQTDEVLPASFVIDAGATAVTPRLTTESNNENKDDLTLVASNVTVNGTLLAERLEMNGVFSGDGQVVILEDGVITIADTAILDIAIADADGSGYRFDNVQYSALTLSSENVAGDYIVEIDGTLSSGEVAALKDAYVDDLNIGKDGAIVADVFHISGDVTAQGKIKTKTALTAAELAAIDYDATYAEGDYTVYTWFMYIDQTEVTDITVDGGKFSGHRTGVSDIFIITGINLTIMDGTAIALDSPIIIGTPRTSIGAGTVVTGTIVITANNYVIVYNGAEVSASSIKASDRTSDAESSNFDIEGTPYAVVYANKETGLKDIADTMKPAIAGYTFTMWVAYNTMGPIAGQNVGDTDVTATLIPGKVIVNATAYEGVAYYCNGIEFMSVGMDVQVDVGSIFTAKIVDKDKLEGTPLVNGEVSFKVTQEFNSLEITGVTEKKAPVEEDDDDLGLTEILLIVLVVLIAIMCVILILRLNRS